MMRECRLFAVILSFIACFLLLTPSAARAYHYGFSGGHPNDTAHVLYWTTTLNSTWVNVVNWNRTNNVDPTIFSTAWTPDHTGSDASVYNKDLGSNATGQTLCETRSAVDANMCLHAHVEFNHLVPLSYDEQRKVGCHELGHSVGLAHRTETSFVSCMKQGQSTFMWYDDTRSATVGHDESEINRHDPPGWDDNLPPSHVY